MSCWCRRYKPGWKPWNSAPAWLPGCAWTLNPLPPHVQAQLFRVAEEALNNILKHAAATAVDVVIGGDAGHVRLEIHDNGVGFQRDPAATSAGLGLVSMGERVSELGGTFEVDSTPGNGTTVRVVLQLGSGGNEDNGQSDPRSDL